MATRTLRRYLQPATTLRWHPWAPLIFALLCLSFVFYFGAQWGYAAAGRVHRIDVFAVPAARDMEALTAERWPARALVLEASAFDAAVMSEANRPPGTAWGSFRDAVEATVFPDPRRRAEPTRQGVAVLAERRLRDLSTLAPRWRSTSTYCDEMPRVQRDFLPHYRRLAAAYSTVLGRPVSAETLAPAVPGWRCPAPSAH